MKKILLYTYAFLIFIFLSLAIFNKQYFELNNLEILLNNYENLKDTIDQNKFFYTFLYILISIFWICFVGIITPMLVLSAIMFGYIGCIFSIISFTIGSTISYFFATKFKDSLTKRFKKIVLKDNSFFFFIILRLLPGVPFMIKNFSGVFFNLNYKKFITATILADSPQIIFFVYIFKKLLQSSELLINGFDISALSQEFLTPIILIILFLILIFIIKKKFINYFFKN